MRLDDKLMTRNMEMPLMAHPSVVSVGALGQVIADLDQLNQDTELDFLRIGGKLSEFMQAVSVISSELTNLADSEQGECASLALTHALDRSTEMRAALGDRDGGLPVLRKEIGHLKRTLIDFEGTVSAFHMLALLTRIETARLGSAGANFSQVADDVSLLAGQVQSRLVRALAITDSLIKPIELASRDISALQAGQAKDLPALISSTLVSLSSFRQIQIKAQESSIRLASQYGAISDSFKKLIVSLQFHDITRQQVEHVIEVLKRLSFESGRRDDNAPCHPRGISAVLALQSAQLADAGEKFTASVVSVESNLEEIARHVLEMAHESRTLAGFSEDDKGSVFLPMEQGCRAILTNLGHATNADEATQAARAGLEESIGQMLGPIKEIQKIELQMRRVALNARISAFHLGSTGSALEVLAGSVQQLASECRERSELLGSLSETVTRSRWDGEPNPAGDSRKGDGTTGELRSAVENLHSSSEISYARIQVIVSRGDSLVRELSATRKSFTVGSLFAQTVKRARRSIKEIAEKTQLGLPRETSDKQEAGFADFVSHYTMQAERDVHDAVNRAVNETAHMVVPTTVQNFAQGVSDELGDNVEFF